jgi:drug/metabolite transporter (DMT)-like permease
MQAGATTGQQRTMSSLDWAKLILLGGIWGGSFFFARVAVAEMHPLVLVLFRVAFAAMALHAYLLVRGQSFRAAVPMAGSFVMLGLINNVVPFSLIFAGQTEMGAGLASVLNATTPFWTIMLANAFTADEKLSWNKVAGVLLGIGGVATMVGPGILASLGGPVWAKLAIIGASLSYAVGLIFARRFRAVPAAIVATGQLTASTVIMIPVVGIGVGFAGMFEASAPVWIAVLALALLSTAFAYILYFGVLRSAGATNASLVTLIVPASAMLLGFVFLGERLESFEIAGMLMIGLGLVTIDGRILRRR